MVAIPRPPGPVVTPPTLTPRPPSAPPPPPPLAPPVGLSVTLSCTPAAHTQPTDCNVTASYNGVTLASAFIPQVGWDWGDGHTTATTTAATSYSYPFAGSYTIFAYPVLQTPGGAQTVALTHGVTIP